MKRFMLSICILLLVSSCSGEYPDQPITEGKSQGGVAFNQDQHQIADQIISVFENNTPVLQYGYAENLDDGRGLTAGRAGFTSATGDMLEVIERYTELVPDNPLAVYLPRLRELSDSEDGSTDGLEGLEEIWQATSKDAFFRIIQDELVYEYYYEPAKAYAEDLGASWPLTLLNLYDGAIQHGGGDDPDGLFAMINRATAEVAGTPKAGIDEGDWLWAFMQIRLSVLFDPDNQETQEEWSESVGRIDTLIELYESGNFFLIPPIEIDTWGDIFLIP